MKKRKNGFYIYDDDDDDDDNDDWLHERTFSGTRPVAWFLRLSLVDAVFRSLRRLA